MGGTESAGPEKQGTNNWRMHGKIGHVGYIMDLLELRQMVGSASI